MMTMLTREQIVTIRSENWPTQKTLCAMALALLDVSDLVPGEGDVAERVRRLCDVAREAYARQFEIEWPGGTAQDLATAGMMAVRAWQERTATLEAELAEARRERDHARRSCERAALESALAEARKVLP